MQSLKSILYYFFVRSPGPECKYYIPLIILAIFLIAGSIIFSKIYKQRKKEDFAFKKLFKKLPSRMLVMGVILTILIIVRYENIPYFSMRIWLYLYFIILAYFCYKYIKIYKDDYPREKQNTKKDIKKKETKYLPHKKKKR